MGIWRVMLATAIVGTAAMTAAPALAHHSFAMFDNQQVITLSGTVKEFQWTNPHSWIQLVVTGPKGKAVEWSIECTAPTALSRMGWRHGSLKPGDKAVVVIHPLKAQKEDAPGGSMMSVSVNGAPIGTPFPS